MEAVKMFVKSLPYKKCMKMNFEERMQVVKMIETKLANDQNNREIQSDCLERYLKGYKEASEKIKNGGLVEFEEHHEDEKLYYNLIISTYKVYEY